MAILLTYQEGGIIIMMNNTIIRRKGEIKTETELKTLLENRGGKNFAERIFIESCESDKQ